MTKKWLASTWPLPALLVWLLAWVIFAGLARLLPWWLALLVAGSFSTAASLCGPNWLP